MEQGSKVVTFPKGRARPIAKTGDEKLVADIRTAWRKLGRAIGLAKNAGLTIDTHFRVFDEPTITRKL